MRKAPTLLLAVLTVACGPGGQSPSTPSAPGSASASTVTPPSTTGTAALPTPSGSAGTAGARPPVRAIAPTTMDGALREIGVDPTALPPLNKLEPDKLRKVMKTFTQSLGVQCSHCHDKDFKAQTRNKKIATRMWNDFARGLVLGDGGGVGNLPPIQGGPIYCDSCHGGTATFLHREGRADVAAISQYMTENYEAKLARTDKAKHGCATCHGDPFSGKIFVTRWAIPER